LVYLLISFILLILNYLTYLAYSKLPSSVDNSDIIIEGQCNLTSNKKKKAIGYD